MPAEDPQTSAAAQGPEPSLEAALQRLDEIADELEAGDVELDRSLALYEEGVRLLRLTERVLGAAEARVERLRADGDRLVVEPLPEAEG